VEPYGQAVWAKALWRYQFCRGTDCRKRCLKAKLPRSGQLSIPAGVPNYQPTEHLVSWGAKRSGPDGRYAHGQVIRASAGMEGSNAFKS
jgi:hypothetical protein